MKKLVTLTLVAAALGAASAHAELIEQDLDNPGDGFVTLDSDTGKQWLDLTLTTNMSIGQVSALLDSQYAGWRLPAADEVRTLMRHAFPSYTFAATGKTALHGVAEADVAAFGSYFGFTNGLQSTGIYLNDPAAPDGETALLLSTTTNHLSVYNHLNLSDDVDYIHNSGTYGVWLVRDVPGPLGLGVLGLALAGVAGRRRR